MQNIDDLVSSLDSQALYALQAFSFSGSHLVWSDECDQILSDVYTSVVRTTKDDIRAVARDFRGQHRTYRLLHHIDDLVQRSDTLRLMLSAVDLLTAHPSRVPRLEPSDRSRIRESFPNLHCTMRGITERLSSWQEDVGAALATFCLLEEPEETLEELLASLPDTIPGAYVSQGRHLIDQLVSLSAERRDIAVHTAGLTPDSQERQRLVARLNTQRGDQQFIIESFNGLITQIVDVPSFHFTDLEFTASQLSGASSLYSCLFVCRRNINERMVHLEAVSDCMIDVVEASQE